MKTIHLLLYPLLQVCFLLLGCYFMYRNIYLTLLFGFLSALFLNFSLHISIHFHVHFKLKNKYLNSLTDFLASILIGIPFHYYQLSHWNHHRHNNSIEDFTSTWTSVNGTIIPKSFLRILLFWPFAGSIRISEQIKIGKKEGYFTTKNHSRLKFELILNLIFISTLFIINIYVGYYYLCIFYVGWSMIAIHNYGQHLPEKYGVLLANSYYDNLYNNLFYNNGLYYEHHQKPELKYWELKSENKGKISHPHLLEGFYFLFKPKK